MKFNLIFFSTALFGAQQILAGPSISASSISSVSVSDSHKAVPAASSSIAAPTLAINTPSVDGAITLDPQLSQELGWSQKQTDLLTGFLDAIEGLGDLTSKVFDAATRRLLDDFKQDAHRLIANSGYKYQPATDGSYRRVLLRMSDAEAAAKGVYTPQGIPEIVEKLVQGLTALLNKLKKSADGGSVIAQKVYTVVENLLTSLGQKIEDHLFPKSKTSSGTAATTPGGLPPIAFLQ